MDTQDYPNEAEFIAWSNAERQREFPRGEFPDQGHEPSQDELRAMAQDQWRRDNDRCGDPDDAPVPAWWRATLEPSDCYDSSDDDPRSYADTL